MSHGPLVDALDQLSAVLPGLVLRPGDPGWEQALHRLHLRGTPAAVVAVADEEDVVAAVEWASRHGVGVAVRPAGDGLVALDVAGLRRLVVDVDRRIARVGAGVTCEALLAAVGGSGLTWPVWGSRSATVAAIAGEDAVAGYTVAGVDLVRPSGDRRWVTAADPGLCAALRGGEQGLGVVVGLDVALHPKGVPAPCPPALE